MNSTDKEISSFGIMKVIKHILLTAPTTGLGIGDIIQKINKQGSFQLEDSKLRNLIYQQVWSLTKRKGYKNISSVSRKYALRKEDSIINEVQKDPRYDEESLFIKAKNASLDVIYHSPKGVPCKIINISEEEVKIKSLITNQIITVEPNFLLVPEEKILEKMKEHKLNT